MHQRRNHTPYGDRVGVLESNSRMTTASREGHTCSVRGAKSEPLICNNGGAITDIEGVDPLGQSAFLVVGGVAIVVVDGRGAQTSESSDRTRCSWNSRISTIHVIGHGRVQAVTENMYSVEPGCIMGKCTRRGSQSGACQVSSRPHAINPKDICVHDGAFHEA